MGAEIDWNSAWRWSGHRLALEWGRRLALDLEPLAPEQGVAGRLNEYCRHR